MDEKTRPNKVKQLIESEYDNGLALAYKILRRKDLAKDAVSDVTLNLLRMNSENFKTISKLDKYFLWAVRNEAIRIQERENKFGPFIGNEQNIEAIDTLLSNNFNKALRILLAILADRNESYATIIELYYLRGFTHADIGREMGIKEQNSRVKLKRALAAFRLIINEFYPFDDPDDLAKQLSQKGKKHLKRYPITRQLKQKDKDIRSSYLDLVSDPPDSLAHLQLIEDEVDEGRKLLQSKFSQKELKSFIMIQSNNLIEKIKNRVKEVFEIDNISHHKAVSGLELSETQDHELMDELEDHTMMLRNASIEEEDGVISKDSDSKVPNHWQLSSVFLSKRHLNKENYETNKNHIDPGNIIDLFDGGHSNNRSKQVWSYSGRTDGKATFVCNNFWDYGGQDKEILIGLLCSVIKNNYPYILDLIIINKLSSNPNFYLNNEDRPMVQRTPIGIYHLKSRAVEKAIYENLTQKDLIPSKIEYLLKPDTNCWVMIDKIVEERLVDKTFTSCKTLNVEILPMMNTSYICNAIEENNVEALDALLDHLLLDTKREI